MSQRAGKNLARFVLVGASGRMGREIAVLAEGSSRLKLEAKVNSAADWKKIAAARIDLVVDFSTPAGFSEALAFARKNKIPFLSGTTGLGAKDKAALAQAGKTIPALYSANMSLGVAAMNKMLEAFGAVRDWDFQIEETHHSRKKDKPSGTALLLQEKLAKVIGRRPPKPLSIRGGGVAGIHEIGAFSEEEMLTVRHTAFNRRVFARGALHGAQWLIDNNRPGLYDLSDLYKMP